MRAYDREHAVKLVGQGVDSLVRETFESAMVFGENALRELGIDADEAATTSAEVRRRDAERFELDIAGGLQAGSRMMLRNTPKPTPFTTPTRQSKPLSEKTAKVARGSASGH